MRKKIIAGILIILTLVIVVSIPAEAKLGKITRGKCQRVEKHIKRKFKSAKIYTMTRGNEEIVWNIILTRKKRRDYVVIKSYGTVLNKRGDGKDDMGYYISYRGIRGISRGKRVITYLVYGKGNNEPDDFIARYDVVVGK